MDALIKAVKSPIHRPFSLSSKHKKLPDKWSDYEHQDKVVDGVTFYVKYLGNTLVTELDEEGQSYGDSISADAVKTIVAMAKASGKKLPKMSIHVSPQGITVTNTETREILTDLDIYRICFCTADRDHSKVFAYIARNKDNETMECQAFLCSKRKIAETVTLTVAESFKLAKEQWEEEEMQIKEKQPSFVPSLLNQKMMTTTLSLVVTKGQNYDERQKQQSSCSGFDDNFSDIKVMKSSLATDQIEERILNPFKILNFSSSLCLNDVDQSVAAISNEFPASPEDADGATRGPTCCSPSAYSDLVCL